MHVYMHAFQSKTNFFSLGCCLPHLLKFTFNVFFKSQKQIIFPENPVT